MFPDYYTNNQPDEPNIYPDRPPISGEEFPLQISAQLGLGTARQLLNAFLSKSTEEHKESMDILIDELDYPTPPKEYIVLYYLYSSIHSFLMLISAEESMFMGGTNYGYDDIVAANKFVKISSVFLYLVNFPLYDGPDLSRHPLPEITITPQTLIMQLKSTLFKDSDADILNGKDASYQQNLSLIMRCLEKLINPRGLYPLPS